MYAVRLIFIVISGFIFILFLSNNQEMAEFFCGRYSSLDYDEKTSETEELWDTCVFRLRVWAWFVYIPTIVF